MLSYARGSEGCLQYGYQTAAKLGKWTLTRAQGQTDVYHITAPVLERNPLWMHRKPLKLSLKIGRAGRRVWSAVEIQENGEHVSITARGKPER